MVALLTRTSHLLTRLAQQRGGEVKARETSPMERRATKDDEGARRLHPSSDARNGRTNKDVTPALTKTKAGLKNTFLMKDQHSCTKVGATKQHFLLGGLAAPLVESRLPTQYDTVRPTWISQLHRQTAVDAAVKSCDVPPQCVFNNHNILRCVWYQIFPWQLHACIMRCLGLKTWNLFFLRLNVYPFYPKVKAHHPFDGTMTFSRAGGTCASAALGSLKAWSDLALCHWGQHIVGSGLSQYMSRARRSLAAFASTARWRLFLPKVARAAIANSTGQVATSTRDQGRLADHPEPEPESKLNEQTNQWLSETSSSSSSSSSFSFFLSFLLLFFYTLRDSEGSKEGAEAARCHWDD